MVATCINRDPEGGGHDAHEAWSLCPKHTGKNVKGRQDVDAAGRVANGATSVKGRRDGRRNGRTAKVTKQATIDFCPDPSPHR